MATDIYIYISAGPCLSGATRLPGVLFQSLFPSPFKSTVQFSSISSPAVCNVLFTGAQNGTTYLPLTVSSQPRPLQGTPSKIIKFQACSQDPTKSKKVIPRSPQVTKMTPKTTPRTPIYCKSSKSETIEKQQYLPWFKHIQPS